ncbi:hypothetical protein J2797_006214 [Paraburkholderia terricola]|uniref:hypothetical protein n=1 Tax=Paraburkholderia terricola TaxID=169427 RepID=UPI0028574CC5|nr:hypothetical protein [Paraburkholderia terricola]MDR6496287.1 hypothetical protein [Paraburkholderia terricola]
MKEPRIIVNHLPNRPQVVLDKATGALTPVHGEVLPIRGACSPAAGKQFCLYEEDGCLFLQLGEQRWEIESGTTVNYYHDFDRKVSTFSIGEFQIEYEAWWAHDPGFNKFAPEEDEDFDFLAYVYQLWMNDSRREALIKRWAVSA